MNFKKISILLLAVLIIASSLSIVTAYDINDMTIEGGSFSTDSGLEDKTYASIYVGDEYAGEDVIIQIYYSRDGSLLNHGNMVPKTVTSNGYIEVASADAYRYYPDFAEINLYDTDSFLLDSQNVTLSPSNGLQTFGTESDYSYSQSSSTSYDNYNSYDDSGSYIGNKNTHKFHSSGCSDVNKMKDKNKIYFSSRSDAINSGYKPCGHCNP